jgi:uncharacterized protein
VAGGLEVAVRLTPRAGRDALGGTVVGDDGAAWFLARVTAPPEAGKANEALLGLLARGLGVPPSVCRLVAGATSRRKRVRVEAADPAVLAARIEALAAAAAADGARP